MNQMSPHNRYASRVLLFSPPLRERTYAGRPPIYYLSAALRRAGHVVQTIDVDIAGQARFLDLLKSFRPSIVAGSSLSVQINEAMRLFRLTKATWPDAVTILGGSHATAAGEYLFPLHASYLDGVVTGEGITPLVAIADIVAKGSWLSRRADIPGLLFCEGSIIARGPRARAESPEAYSPDLPYEPAYDFDIFAHSDGRLRRTFQFMTAFGCQNACFFCFSSTNKRGEGGRIERRMSLACVERTLHRAASEGYEAVYFDDDTFTRVPSHAIEVARLCKKYGLVFGCHTRPDCEDDAVVRELVANGCRYMFSGLESVVPEILIGANKTHDPASYREAYRTSYHLKNELGLPACAFLIHGMPRRKSASAAESLQGSRFGWEVDTIADSIASVEFAVRELDPSYLSMNVLRFIPGVPFSESHLFEFLRPVAGKLHGGYFDETWMSVNGAEDPRCFHPILRAFEGAGSPLPTHMTPQRCYEVLRHTVEIVNAKNREPNRNQTKIVTDQWFSLRFLREQWYGAMLAYELAPFAAIDAEPNRDVA